MGQMLADEGSDLRGKSSSSYLVRVTELSEHQFPDTRNKAQNSLITFWGDKRKGYHDVSPVMAESV